MRPILSICSVLLLCSCTGPSSPTTDEKQAAAQQRALEQAHAQIGMPAVTDFAEKRMIKDLYELRDKPGPTHAYLFNPQLGCLTYLGAAVGYGIPYATQYTAPTRTQEAYDHGGTITIQVPQAEPNGLFMPAAAEGTWIMLKDPGGDDVKPVYVEPRVIMSPFRLTNAECKPAAPQAPAAEAPKGK